MSHTNSTTNYNLPQFVGTDKPAWLGDINPAMSAIDTAIKSAKDAGDTADGKATQAQATADGIATNVGTLTNTVSALSNTVTAQGGDINTNATNIQKNSDAIVALAEHFNLSDFTTINLNDMKSLSVLTNYVDVSSCDLTLAQNDDGSIFKFYGRLYMARSASSASTMPKTAIPGLTNTYGIPTGLYLKSAPTNGFVIQGGAMNVPSTPHTSIVPNSIWNLEFAVGTDGQIYLYAGSSTSETWYGQSSYRTFYWANLYFAKDFGDDIISE